MPYSFLKNIGKNPELEAMIAREEAAAADQAARSGEQSVGQTSMADTLKRGGIIDDAGRISPEIAASSSEPLSIDLNNSLMQPKHSRQQMLEDLRDKQLLLQNKNQGQVALEDQRIPRIPDKSLNTPVPTAEDPNAAAEILAGKSAPPPEAYKPSPVKFTERPEGSITKEIDSEAETLPTQMNRLPAAAEESDTVSKYQKFKDLIAKNKGMAAATGGAAAAGTYVGLKSGDKPEDVKASMSHLNISDKDKAGIEQFAVPEDQKSKEEDDSDSEEETSPAQPSVKAPVKEAPEDKLQTIDFGQGNSASQDKYNQMLESMQSQQRLNNFARAMSGMVASASGNKDNFDQMYADQAKQIAQQPDQYRAQVEFAKQDPNSPVSQGYRQIAKQMGFNIVGNASAADLEKLYPQFAKIADTKDTVAARKEMAKERAQSASERANQAILDRKDKLDEHKKDTQLKNYNATVQQLEQMRGSPAVAQAEKDILAAAKAEKLVHDLGGNPDKLNPQMVNLYTTEIGKIASGGQSSISELNNLTPVTLGSRMAGVWQQLRNQPTPANLGAFIKQYQNYSKGLTQVAQKTIEDRYGRFINSRASQFSPDQLETLNNTYINRFKDIAKGDYNPSNPNDHHSPGIPKPVAPPKPQDVDKMSDEEVEAQLQARGL